MGPYVILSEEDWATEFRADAILAQWKIKGERSFSTERCMSRRGGSLIRLSVDYLLEVEAAPGQSFREELRFLISISHLSAVVKSCLKLWVDGYTQTEIANQLMVSQQTVSTRLKQGLNICYDLAPISFRAYCKRSIYYKPTKAPERITHRMCVYCHTLYQATPGRGRYCSGKCIAYARKARTIQA